MRIRIQLILYIMGLVILTLSLFSIIIFQFFRSELLAGIDATLSNWADVIYQKQDQDPNIFYTNPDGLIMHPRSKEYPANSVAVCIADAHGKPRAYSPALLPADILINTDKDTAFYQYASRTTVYRAYQIPLVRKEKTYGYIVTVIPITRYAQTIQRFGGILMLITLGTILVLSLGVATLASANIVLNQKRFLSFASHELKIPLAVISGNIQLLLRKKKRRTREEQAILETIKSKSDWMNKLIANLLLNFRTESGAESIHKKEFDLGDMLIEEYSQLKDRYPQKQITIDLQTANNSIRADETHLRKAVANVLDNAAKYTEPRGTISLELTGQGTCHVIRIKDDGQGIAREHQKKIFEPFYRIDPSVKEGMGLGLAICKWVVTQHGGQIVVSDNTPHGTIFTITLPKL